MTTVCISANLCLGGGRRVSSENPTTKRPTWHSFYDTALESNEHHFITSEIRVYSPVGDKPFPPLTVANVIGKVAVMPGHTILIEALNLTPYPGDPSSSAYEDHLPTSTTAYVWAIGTVKLTFRVLQDGISRVFDLAVGEFVRDSMKYSTIQYVSATFARRSLH